MLFHSKAESSKFINSLLLCVPQPLFENNNVTSSLCFLVVRPAIYQLYYRSENKPRRADAFIPWYDMCLILHTRLSQFFVLHFTNIKCKITFSTSKVRRPSKKLKTYYLYTIITWISILLIYIFSIFYR